MGKVICGRCGAVIDERDIMIEDARDCDVDVEYCPECRRASEFYEAAECEICGEYHIAEHGYDDVEMYDGICMECLLEASVDECKKVAEKGCKHMIEINAFLACAFTAAEIEDILTDALKANPKNAVKEYVDGDPDWFAEKYKEVRAEWNS